MTGTDLPAAGRVVHRSVTALVAAAAARDQLAVRDACALVRECDQIQVRDVLHLLVLGLVEQAFPDGLDADDVRSLMAEVSRSAAAWLPDPGLDPQAVALVLTGALSVHETDAPAPSGPDALPTACAVVVAHLLGLLRLSLPPELARVFDDLRTSQTMEIP